MVILVVGRRGWWWRCFIVGEVGCWRVSSLMISLFFN